MANAASPVVSLYGARSLSLSPIVRESYGRRAWSSMGGYSSSQEPQDIALRHIGTESRAVRIGVVKISPVVPSSNRRGWKTGSQPEELVATRRPQKFRQQKP